MASERDSLPELEQRRVTIEHKVQAAQAVYENIANPDYTSRRYLRLDSSIADVLEYADNLDRVTAIQERLLSRSIPKFQTELSEVTRNIEVYAAVDTLSTLRNRYQRIQERAQRGISVPEALLTPLATEIERLEAIVSGNENIVKAGDTIEVGIVEQGKPQERYIVYKIGTPEEIMIRIVPGVTDAEVTPGSIVQEGNKRYLVGSIGSGGELAIDEEWEVEFGREEQPEEPAVPTEPVTPVEPNSEEERLLGVFEGFLNQTRARFNVLTEAYNTKGVDDADFKKVLLENGELLREPLRNPELFEAMKVYIKREDRDLEETRDQSIVFKNLSHDELDHFKKLLEEGMEVPAGPVEPTPEDDVPNEDEKLPILIVNRANREITFNGKTVKLATDLQWSVFTALAGADVEGMSSQELTRTIHRFRSNTTGGPGIAVRDLKLKFEKGLQSSDFIKAKGRSVTSRFLLAAKVQFTPSNLVIDQSENVVEIDGRRIMLAPDEMKLLRVLSSSLGEFKRSRDITSEALDYDDPVSIKLRILIHNLNKKINYPFGPEFIESRMAGANSGYRLQGVNISFVESATSDESELKEQDITPEEKTKARIASIQKMIDDGVLTNPDQIKKAQEVAAQFDGTIEFNPATVDQDKPKPDLTFRKVDKDEIATWIKEKSQKEDELTFTEEEQAVLARFVENLDIRSNRRGVKVSKDLTFFLTLEPGTIESCQKLADDFYNKQPEHVNGHLKEIRLKAVEKLEKLFNGEKADERMILIKGDIGMIIRDLKSLDNKVKPSRLIEFLRTRIEGGEYSYEVSLWVSKVIEVFREESRDSQIKFVTAQPVEEQVVPEERPAEQVTEAEQPERPRIASVVDIDALLVASTFLDNPSGITPQEIVELLSKTEGRGEFNWVEIVNPVIRLVRVINGRIAAEFASEEEKNLLLRIRELVGKKDEVDIEVVTEAWREKLVEWFKEKTAEMEEAVSESLVELVESNLTPEEVFEIEEDPEVRPQRPNRLPGSMNTNEFIRYVYSKGFTVGYGGNGDLQVLEGDRIIATLTSFRGGGRSIGKKTYHRAIKNINMRWQERNRGENND